MEDNKKGVTESKFSTDEALLDFNNIWENAETIAEAKLKKEFPNKLENYLKEEIQKNFKKNDEPEKVDNTKETIKVYEGVDNKTDSDNTSNATTNEPEKVNESKDADTVKKVVTKTNEKSDDKSQINEDCGCNENESNMAYNGMDEVEQAFNEAHGSDQVGVQGDNSNIDMRDIEAELNRMDSNENTSHGSNIHEKYAQMESVFEQLGGMMNEMKGVIGTDTSVQASSNDKIENYGVTEQEVVESSVDEMHKGNQHVDKLHKGEIGPETIAEEQAPVAEAEVDEAHGITLSGNKKMDARNPRPEFKGEATGRYRPGDNIGEANIKFKKVLEENKKLNKKLQTLKENIGKKDEEVTELLNLNEEFKDSLKGYGDQIKDLAKQGVNVAHVNNILVNENLALTFDDKKEIIKRFSGIKTITESKETYRKILKEYSSKKETINENVEDKIKSSNSLVTEKPVKENLVVESTASVNGISDSHMKKIRTNMGLN